MNFRQRLVLFLVVTLVGVQSLAGLLGYMFIRYNLVEQAKQELNATASVFNRQLDVLSERVTDDVSVLSLDYPLRKAVAEEDRSTALSALRNHGARVGATRMMLLGLDGAVKADTRAEGTATPTFPFPSLMAQAYENGRDTALAVVDGAAYWIVVVPVRAPVTIAFIVACVPVNTGLLEKLRFLSPVPRSLALATADTGGAWHIVSATRDFSSAITLPSDGKLRTGGDVVQTKTSEHLAMTAALPVAAESKPISVVLDYPLERAMAAYRAVLTPMLFVLLGALIIALCGAFLVARSVSRPLEQLATTARRIALGDYTPPP